MKATYELQSVVLVIPYIIRINEVIDSYGNFSFIVFLNPGAFNPTFRFESEEQMVAAKNDLVKAINEFYEQCKSAL